MRGPRVPASETTPDKLITRHGGTSEDTLDNYTGIGESEPAIMGNPKITYIRVAQPGRAAEPTDPNGSPDSSRAHFG